MELKKEYPSVDFTIINIPDFPKDPSTATFEEVKDMLKGLPYDDNTFDLVHQRYRCNSFTDQQLKDNVINDYVRVIKPGGWIEFTVCLLLLMCLFIIITRTCLYI